LAIGVRGKLFGLSVLLIVSVVLASGAFLEAELRELLEKQVEAQILAQARTARLALSSLSDAESSEIDALAERLGEASKARVTVIARDGRVLGDSQVPLESLGELENHAARPEVVAALRDGVGLARRYSTTVHADLLYVALPFPEAGEPRGVVRLAMEFAHVDREVGRLRFAMLLAGAVGLVVAVLMSGVAAELISRAFRVMVENARALAHRERSDRIDASRRDELGGLAGSFNTMADELEQAVSSLAAERDRLQTTLEHMHDAVLLLDSTDRLALANPAALRLLGISERAFDKPIIEVLRVPELAEMIEHARAGASGAREFELPAPRSRTLEVHAAPMPRMEGSLLVMHDVTEVRRLERVRRDFVANVSHELRTPVSVIQANAETLIDGALRDTAHAHGFIDAIHRNAERLGRLIADVLELSRIEAGVAHLTLGPVMVKAAMTAAVDALAEQVGARGITISVEADDGIALRADPAALGQILGNLLDNAVKYATEGGRVCVRASVDEESEDTVRIEVEDDGPGIDRHHRKRVFERFYRVDAGRSRQLGGTGLGLSIVKHLVEAMSGRVGVEPASNRGSIFWVELPRDVPSQVSS
jgi:two-component system phosphate regulon sensor histidine kinase PhoR